MAQSIQAWADLSILEANKLIQEAALGGGEAIVQSSDLKTSMVLFSPESLTQGLWAAGVLHTHRNLSH